jgi:nicotinamidase-related amidase
MAFRPALIVVDLQEDFCPPNGSLAVKDGRSIAPVINSLLELPFTIRIATKDYHPPDHISFASNHPPPDNKPFESIITIPNPLGGTETETTRLWPVHCVQGTGGVSWIPEFNAMKIDKALLKGMDKRVEMYSAFSAPFRNPVVAESGLTEMLKDAKVTHVYTVGLAADYCVKFTALDAAREGFKTVVIEEGTKPVDPASMEDVKRELEAAGVKFVSVDGEEVKAVKELSQSDEP